MNQIDNIENSNDRLGKLKNGLQRLSVPEEERDALIPLILAYELQLETRIFVGSSAAYALWNICGREADAFQAIINLALQEEKGKPTQKLYAAARKYYGK